jgi:membrane protein DedA with SNARE-associated domain
VIERIEMDFTHLVATFGYMAVLVFVAIQCAGIPFPGGAVFLAAAIYAGVTHQLEVGLIIVAAAAGAILGSLLGFWLGSRGGYRVLVRHRRFLRLDERKLKLGQYLFLKHGGKIVVLGRFVSVTRTWAGLLAGINKMAWARFLLFSVVGGVIWATAIGLGAYYLGDALHRPTGPLGIAFLMLVLCLFVACLFFLLRNLPKLEEQAELAIPGPLDLDTR